MLARDKAAAFTEDVASFSPCTIFAAPVFVPKTLARGSASNAAMVLSDADSLLFAAKRIGKIGTAYPLRDPLNQRNLDLAALGPHGFAHGEPPGLVFPLIVRQQ
jgi:hypothetical protein